MNNPPWGFKIEYWYHALAALGAAGIIASLSIEMHGIANAHVLLVALGWFFIGIGEWVNHPLKTTFTAGTAYHPSLIGEGHPRDPNSVGLLFDVLGFVLVAIGVYKIAAAS